MALQLFSRLFTFGLNQALFRMASPQSFGTAAIQFELMLSTILFLSREGVRNAMLRAGPRRGHGGLEHLQGNTSLARRNSITNVTLLPLIFGFPLAILTSCLYVQFARSDTRSQPHFHMAINIYAMAAIVELLSEPMHNR
jgi:oligosaccharide translocation protein RFT1